jgi:intracellular multiplication protein IcmT
VTEARCHWSYTAERPRLFVFDARLAYPVVLWLLHWSWATFALAAACAAALLVLDRLGIPPDAALLLARARLVGPVRPAADESALRRRARL